MTKKILFVVNVDWFFISHRLPIALEALKKGYEVHIAVFIIIILPEVTLIISSLDQSSRQIILEGALDAVDIILDAYHCFHSYLTDKSN